MTNIKLIRRWPSIGSGTVIVGVIVVVLLVLLDFGARFGWIRTWRSFGVLTMLPPFRDMHAVTDHAACAAKGFNAYFPNVCDPLRTVFNYPPAWLWLGYLGIGSADTAWLSVLITIAALGVFVAMLKGRSIYAGAIGSLAILSPSVMLGIERGNVDLFILALVGGAALIIAERRPVRLAWAIVPLGLAVVLKLYPVFCVALVTRCSRRTIIFSFVLAIMSLIYFWAISDYISIIRINTPSIYLVSYGYKVAFLGFDQLLAEVKQMPTGLAGTWVPITAAVLILILAGAIALCAYRRGISDCTVADNTSGTAFLFGAGIYCGSFMLGANFVYRLMFLLLCLPQLLDWLSATSPGGQRTLAVARFLLFASLLALWLNAYPNFMPVPQVVDWTLLFGLTAVLLLNFLNSANPREIIMTRHAERIVER